jgi:catechol 2,3-dioxygenase-like lactoylglutathione lyase family enzyme
MRASAARLLALSIVGASLAAPTAWAAPIPASAPQTPTVMRRTALIVRDVDASLQFYRDALGLIVVDDRTHRNPEDAKTDADLKSMTRIILLRANDDWVGQLELVYYGKPVHAPLPPVTDNQRHPGGFVMLFSTKDLASTFKKAKAVPGARVAEEPHPVTYKSYDGPGMTTDMFGYIYDPDGNYVEINQPSVAR